MDELFNSKKLGGAGMSNNFHHFVEKITKQIDGREEEKADIYEELMTHLHLSKKEFITAGYDENKAEQKAMIAFGDANGVGRQIQEAMFPYRKLMLLTLAIGSLLFSFSIYLMILFSYGNAHFGWLILSVLTSSTLLLFAFQILSSLDRKFWLNTILIIHGLFYLYGTLLAIEPVTSIVGWLLIALTITLIYRTATYLYDSSSQEQTKQIKRIHILNITAGLIIVGATLFFLWAILAFGDREASYRFIIIFIPLLIWILSYITQIKLLTKKRKKTAYTVALAPILIVLGIIIFLILPAFRI